MGLYQNAYECYREACENFGMESMSISQFIKHLTKEQLHEYMKHTTN